MKDDFIDVVLRFLMVSSATLFLITFVYDPNAVIERFRFLFFGY